MFVLSVSDRQLEVVFVPSVSDRQLEVVFVPSVSDKTVRGRVCTFSK